MNNLNLTNELNKLWEGRILNLEFDILHHKIKFKIKVYRPGTRDEQFDIYNVVFSGVSSFYFLQNTDEDRFRTYDPDPGDTTELTTIGYYKDGIGKIKIVTREGDEDAGWASQWYSSANFALELDPSALFIEARSITINDKTYEVGYPLDEGGL